MAARAYWQGQIRLALVSIAVELYPATRSGAALSFRQIHEPTGKPIRYEKVVEGVGPIDHDEIVKGYEIARGDYVLLEEDEIEAAKVESRRMLDLVQFVDADEVDVLYYEKPYFVLPADDLAEEPYAVLREALKATHKVGIGQLSVRGREQLVSLKPCGRGLILEILRYADEVKRAQTFFRVIPEKKADPDLIDLATTIIEKKSKPFDPEDFHDRYVDALERLIEKKKKAGGRKVLEDVEEPATPKSGSVLDLMAALKQSVGQDDKPSRRKTRAPTARKAKAPARRSTRKRA